MKSFFEYKTIYKFQSTFGTRISLNEKQIVQMC